MTTATTVPEANQLRGDHRTSSSPVVVDRLVGADEAYHSAMALAVACTGKGPRPSRSTPPQPTDDDVTVLAFIAQHRDPVLERRLGTVQITAEATVGRPLIAGVSMASVELALAAVAEEVRSKNTLATEEADRLTNESMAAAAASLVTGKPKATIPGVTEIPTERRDRLVLAASLLVQEIARLDRAASPIAST